MGLSGKGNNMKAEDMTKYLSGFSPESKVSIVVANPDKGSRSLYPVEDFLLLEKDRYNDNPCFVVCIGVPKSLDLVGVDEISDYDSRQA